MMMLSDKIVTAYLCLNSSMYVYMLLGKVRTLLEWADEILSKMLDIRIGDRGVHLLHP